MAGLVFDDEWWPAVDAGVDLDVVIAIAAVVGRVHADKALHHQARPLGSKPIEHLIDESTGAVRWRPAAPSHMRSRAAALMRLIVAHLVTAPGFRVVLSCGAGVP